MVDFRYLLVTIVAVFLALGIGILAGTAVSDDLARDVDRRIDAVRENNAELHAQIDDLRARIATDEEFATVVERWFVDGALEGKDVAVVVVDGTDGSIVDELSEELEQAGATPTGTITLTDKLALEDATERDELALVLSSSESDAGGLRTELGTVLGSTSGVASETPGFDPQSPPASERVDRLLADLERADYVTVDRDDERPTVSAGTSFLIVAGSEEDAPFPVEDVVVPFIRELADHETTVLVSEPSDSAWGLVAGIRDDAETSEAVATVDMANTIPGQIAVVLGLDLAGNGDPGHYGLDEGASSVIPLPAPSP